MILDLLVRDSRRVAALKHVVHLPAIASLLDVTERDGGIEVTYEPPMHNVSDGQMALLLFVDELGSSDRPRLPDISHLDNECVAAVYAAVGALLMVVPAQRGAVD